MYYNVRILIHGEEEMFDELVSEDTAFKAAEKVKNFYFPREKKLIQIFSENSNDVGPLVFITESKSVTFMVS